jgi:hypothetical protein
MGKLMKIGLIFLFFIVLGAGLLYYHTEQLSHQTFNSAYSYDISLNSDSELKNITFYLPLPVYENVSECGNELINRSLQENNGWHSSIVDTENGKMLVLKADRFVPEMHSREAAISEEIPEENEEAEPVENAGVVDEGQEEEPSEEAPETEIKENSPENVQFSMPLEFHGGFTSDSEINTRLPLGNEPVLSPAYNLTLSKYDMPYPENREPPTVYDYNSLIYADYETSPEAKVYLAIHSSGMNEWWIYGWNWNQYSEQIFADLTGQQQGWVDVQGKITMGEGSYR